MKASHLISFLNPMKRKIIDITDVQENPFIFTLNPIKSGLLIIELMRIIIAKFKSLQVKCLEIEIYMKQALTNYAELLSDESEIQFLLLEKDIEGRDSLEIASQLKFYELF